MESADRHVNDGGLRKSGVRKGAYPEIPLVSIVTVVLNGEKHLEQTIKSVISQTYPNIEYIIIDGGSTDRTIEIIKKYEAAMDYWISGPDKGIYDAMNKGIGICQGVLINLLNADDYLSPVAVETAVDKYVQHQKPCIIYGDFNLIDETLGYQVEVSSSCNFWQGMCISHQSMFVHRSIYATLGAYDAGYSLASDYDFLLRAVRNNVLLVNADASLVCRRLHGRGGKNFIRSKLETNRINRNYFANMLRLRTAFWLNSVLDALKLLSISTLKALLGKKITRHLLMSYYKKRSVNVSRVNG